VACRGIADLGGFWFLAAGCSGNSSAFERFRPLLDLQCVDQLIKEKGNTMFQLFRARFRRGSLRNL